MFFHNVRWIHAFNVRFLQVSLIDECRKKKSFDNSFSMFDMRFSSSISLLSCEAFHSMSFERTWWVEVRLRRSWWTEKKLKSSWWVEKKLKNSWWAEEILKNSWWVEQILKSFSWTKVKLKSSSWIKKKLNNSSWVKVRFEISRLTEMRFETSWWINRFFFKEIFCLLNTLITISFHTSHWTYVCCLKINFFFLIRKTCLWISFIMKLFKSSISRNILWNSRRNATFVQNVKFANWWHLCLWIKENNFNSTWFQ